MTNVALGQYYPSGSVIHRLDGRIKLILAVVFITSCFLCRSLSSFLLLTLFTCALILLARIPFSIIFRAMKGIVYILLITFFFNMFFTVGEEENLIFSWWKISLYTDGIWYAVLFSVRILALIIGTSLFISYTMTPIQLTDSLERLLSPLKKLHIPVHNFAMMMSISLRFIPTLSEETEKIMTAQKARGADFTNGSLRSRIKALIPVLIPLVVSAFRRAEELATAMECRCYHGGEGRTKMNVPKLRTADFVSLGIAAAAVAALILLNRVPFGYVTGIHPVI